MLRLVMLPETFAVPRSEPDRDKFEAYLAHLLSWKSLLSAHWVSITTAEDTAAILADEGCYPIRATLLQLCKNLDIVEYSVQDIARVVDDILARTPSFEEDCDVREILASSPVPSNRIEIAEQRIHQIVGLVNQHKLLANCPEYISVSSTCGASGNCIEHVEAEVIDLEHYSDAKPKMKLPFTIDCSIRKCGDHDHILKCIDVVAYWRYVNDCDMADRLIRIRWLQECSRHGEIVTRDDCPPFHLGSQFLSSIHPFGFLNQENRISALLDRICDLLIKRNLSKTHILRTGPAGNDPPQMRGKDKAYRADLDYEFHLHYWQLDNGGIEFANVVTHNDFHIEK